jgi:hypothetical protein
MFSRLCPKHYHRLYLHHSYFFKSKTQTHEENNLNRDDFGAGIG